MIENALIEEGGLGRKFNPVDKLKVNTTGGEESMWVPEEKHTTGVLHASENGIYIAANDGYESYNQVLVRVENTVGDPTEEWEDVDPTEEADLWDDETLDEYTEDPEEFDDLFNDEEEWDEEETDIEFDKDDKLTGKDPNVDPTGNNDYEVGVDGEGNLTEEMIPAAIHIVVPPRKRKYAEGETLDFSGIHVYLMDGNNHRYTDSQYPTGEIPFGELLFPVTIAHGSGEVEPTATAKSDLDVSTLPNPFAFGMGNRRVINEINIITTSKTVSLTGGTMLVDDNAKIYAYVYVFASKDPFTINLGSSIIAAIEFTYRGKKVYYHGSGGSYPYPEVVLFEPNYNTIIDATAPNVPNIAWTMIYGDITYNDNDVIPVQWIRSDGKTLEDTFKIEVGESEEGEDQPDPWAGAADVSWGGHHYNLNRRIVPEVHYANGYLWQEGISYEYNVEQAASMGWLILIR